MSESTRQIVASVKRKLKTARSRLLLARLAYGLVVALSAAAAVWLVLAGTEAVFWMPTPVRTSVVGVAAVALAVVLAWLVLDPVARLLGILKSPDEDSVARLVETRVAATRNRLLNVLHLSSGRHSQSLDELVDGAIRMLVEPMQGARFDDVESFRGAKRALRFAAIPFLVLLTVVLAAPGPFLGATSRLASPGRSFSRPAPFAVEVSPGDAEVIRGDSLRVRVAIRGSSDVHPEIEIRRAGERSVAAVRPARDSLESFAHTELNIRQDFEYRAVADQVGSPWYSVAVVDRPVVRELRVAVESPAYSRMGRVELGTNVGDVTALPGSRVYLELELGGSPSAVAEVVFDNDERLPLSVTDGKATGQFQLVREGAYRIELRSERDVTSKNPIRYRLELLSDALPSVAIVSPDATSELTDPFEPAVSARVMDDYGIRRVSLMYRLAQSRFGTVSESFEELPVTDFRRDQLDQLVERVWRMRSESRLSPVPGDVYEYFIRVWDNDTFRGFKKADSRIHQFVLPSLADQYRNVEEESEQTEGNLEKLLDKTREVGDRFDELRDELRRKPEAGWDDSRQLEQIEELQREVEQGLQDVSMEVEDLARRMEENSLLSEETLNTYEELQRAIEEINSPELMEALQKLREAMQSMDLQQMQQAIQDFEFNEEQFKERLERALDLFKRLKARQGLEEAARRAEELAKLQEELRKQTTDLDEQQNGTQEDAAGRDQENEAADEGSSQESPEESPDQSSEEPREKSESLARQQEDAEKEMQDLQKRLEDVQEMLEKIPRMPTEQLEELRSRLEEQDVPRQMRENAEQLRQQELQPAMQGQQQMQQQLQQLQQQLNEMQQNMQGRQLQLNMAGLRQALNDVLILSQQQEDAMTRVGNSAADSPALRQYAKRQIELGEGLQVVSDTLRQLAREVPEMSREVQIQTGSALREMGEATELLADRSARRASAHQKSSMMHLNELALLLSDLLNMLMNQQMNMGMPSMQQMLEQLQQMAGQQQQLNQQIQDMLNNLQGQRLTQDMQERMRQLARQQEQIKEELKELSRNPELRGNSLGDLNKIAEEMEETVRELQQFRQNRDLMQRQQQILTRLLDASRSMNTRGREKRRESRTGEEQDRQSPGEFTPDQKADELRRDLIRALESGYAPDYEELIKRYFELLQESQESAPE